MIEIVLTALAVVGGAAAVIFVLTTAGRRQQQRREQELQNAYRSLLAEHDLIPDHEQVFLHRICALDTKKRTLVFVQHRHDVAVIELGDVLNCRPWKDGVKIKRPGGGRADEYIQAIGISFFRKGGMVTTLPFYTEALDGVESKIALSKAADHWLERLNKALA